MNDPPDWRYRDHPGTNADVPFAVLDGKWKRSPTRLQKTVKLLQQLGFPTRYRYTLFFYGPYSEELQAEIDLLDTVGLIDEKCQASSDGTEYYVFAHSQRHERIVAAEHLRVLLRCVHGLLEPTVAQRKGFVSRKLWLNCPIGFKHVSLFPCRFECRATDSQSILRGSSPGGTPRGNSFRITSPPIVQIGRAHV